MFWGGDGRRLTNESSPNALKFSMKTTPEIAENMCMQTCWKAWFIAGRANPENNSIYLNSDRTDKDLVHTIQHEWGHLFFGRGHPQNPGDFLFRGILDYNNSIGPIKADRMHFKDLYRDAIESELK